MSNLSRKPRALVVFSGGLDSTLASIILQKARCEVGVLTFISAFFNADKARVTAKSLGIKFYSEDFTNEHLEIVKNPPNGWGKHINPCIDCHALMFAIANKIRKKKKYDFIATGEVLGQRPFSQNKQALRRVEKAANLVGHILRPLSAKLLPVTEIEKNLEKKGFDLRKNLLDISGRSRKRQLQLAEKFRLTNFPSPGGGCILTDPGYSVRAKALLELNKSADSNDFEIIKHGRFYNHKNGIVMVGRQHDENLILEKLTQKNDYLIRLKNIAGPLALLRIYNQNESVKNAIEFTKEKVKKHATKAHNVNNVEYDILKI